MIKAARGKGVEFVAVDGAQSVGMIPVDLKKYDVDVYAASPHKWLQSPKGLGLAYIHPRLHNLLRPMWVTWGQTRWAGSVRIFEDYGTRNLAEVLSLGDAITFSESLPMEQRQQRLRHLWEHARQRVDDHSQLEWKSPRDWSLSASLYAVGLNRGRSSDVAERLFAEHQIVVRPFGTLGLNSLRVSPNVFNTESEIDRFVDLAGA